MSDNINGVADEALAAEETVAEAPQETVSDGGEPKKPLRLDYAQTFKVGFAFAIIMIFWTAYDFVVPLLLEHAYGLSNTIRGLIMGLDNLLSLFMLPLFGKLSDNAHGKLVKKYGRRTPFIVIGTLASVVLMVFVPISTLNQQKTATNIENGYLAQLDEDTFMEERLAEFLAWEGSYADMDYMAMNGFTADDFMQIRYDDKFTATKAFLGMLGATTYRYDGAEVSLDDAVPELGYTLNDWNGDGTLTYDDIRIGNENYDKYVASGMNTWISDQIYDQATNTTAGHKSLAVYMVILLLVLIAMATFRSPAVALMPDVTPKPLRSQGNAVINLCGGIGGAIAFLIYTIVLFGERLENYVIIFASVAGGMLLLLAGFLAFVREKKMVQRCHEICEEYGITDEDEEPATVSPDESVTEGDADMRPARDDISDEALEIARAKTRKLRTPKEWWNAKSKSEQARFVSFLLILGSIFMWFMGYNAVSSNLSVYTTKALNLDAGVASIISGISMGISAIAFIPVGYMAAKLGRRKTIMIGLAMAIVSFLLIFAFVKPDSNALVPAALFALFYLISGFGLIIINVNTLPMVVELSTDTTVGQYTGYYYVATMSAQAITPMFAGMVMDAFEDRGLFIYSAIFIAFSIILMAFVKHGDSKPIGKGKKLTKEEKKQIRLESLGDPD
ncbi:MAG: MFS transporter [Christensenellales bacterium]|nr:MFS transporter [Christensenellales bacterium]